MNSLRTLLDAWDAALDAGHGPGDLLESLHVDFLRDIVLAAACEDSGDTMARALAGIEFLHGVHRGTAALTYARVPTEVDAAWVSGLIVGEGVKHTHRLENLLALTVEREHLDAPAAANAGCLHAWACCMLGRTADARGTLAAVLDSDPQHRLAQMLLPFVDLRR